MKKLILVFTVSILISIYGAAQAWTVDPFRLGHSTVYASNDEHWYHWYITSHPEGIENDPLVRYAYMYNLVTQVMLIRQPNKEDIIWTNKESDETSAGYEIAMDKLRQITDLLEPYLEEAKLLSVAYHVEFKQISIFPHPDHDRNRELYLKILKMLNERREQLSI